MKRLLLLAFLLFPLVAAAQTATLSWTPAITRADGSLLGASPVTFNVYQQSLIPQVGGGLPYVLVQSKLAVNSATITTGLPASGPICFYVTEVETATTQESAPSVSVCKTIVAVAPNAPTGVTLK